MTESLIVHQPGPEGILKSWPMARWEREAFDRSTQTTLGLIQDFLIFGRQRGYSQRTLDSYRFALTDWFEFFHGPDLRTIKAADIREWLRWLISRGASRQTLNVRMYGLRAFFDRAVLHGVIPLNPARQMKMRRLHRPLPKILTEEQINLLITAATTIRDRALVETYYATGCRLSEVVGRDRKHRLDRTVCSRSQKVKRSGSFRLTPIAAQLLREYIRARTQGFVFRRNAASTTSPAPSRDSISRN